MTIAERINNSRSTEFENEFDLKTFVVRDREAGNIIDYVASKEEGLKLIQEYEQADRAEDIYEPNFYELAEVEL